MVKSWNLIQLTHNFGNLSKKCIKIILFALCVNALHKGRNHNDQKDERAKSDLNRYAEWRQPECQKLFQ